MTRHPPPLSRPNTYETAREADTAWPTIDETERMLAALRHNAVSRGRARCLGKLRTARAGICELALDGLYGSAMAPGDFLTHFLTPQRPARVLTALRVHLVRGARLLADFRVRTAADLAAASRVGAYLVASSGIVDGAEMKGRVCSVASRLWREFRPETRVVTTTMRFDTPDSIGVVEDGSDKNLRRRVDITQEVSRYSRQAGSRDNRCEADDRVSHREWTV